MTVSSPNPGKLIPKFGRETGADDPEISGLGKMEGTRSTGPRKPAASGSQTFIRVSKQEAEKRGLPQHSCPPLGSFPWLYARTLATQQRHGRSDGWAREATGHLSLPGRGAGTPPILLLPRYRIFTQQPHVQQVYWHHGSNSFCSLWVSVSHLVIRAIF